MHKTKLGKAISNTVFNSLLSTFPTNFAQKFSLNEQEVKDFLTEFLSGADSTKPKRTTGPNGYVLFSSSNRKTIQSELETSGKLKDLTKKEAFGLVGKEVGARWSLLPADEKANWNSKAKNPQAEKTAEPVKPKAKTVPESIPNGEVAPAVDKVKKNIVKKKTATESSTVKKTVASDTSPVVATVKKVRKARAKESDDEASK